MTRLAGPVVVAAGVSAVATGAIIAIPPLHFAYRNPELHVALQSVEAVIGLLGAFLVAGRFARHRRLSDLLLVLALSVLGFSNLAFAALPAIFWDDSGVWATWTGVVARLLGAALFAAAALASDRVVRLRPGGVALGAVALLTCVAALVGVLEGQLPRGVEVAAPEESGRPRLEGHITILGAQLASLLLYAVATVGFARRFRATGDAFLLWLAVAAVLSAAARLNYFLYPSLFTDWVYTGDFFRLGFYLVVLIAAAIEIRSYWQRLAQMATLEERRRMARDLHDGLAQELVAIKRNLAWLDADDRFVQRATAGSERALVQARRAIHALSREGSPPLGDAMEEAMQALAEREGARVDVRIAPRIDVTPEAGEALLRIATEAVTNAIRHGRARDVRVGVEGGRRVRLLVEDDGCGFADAPAATVRGGQGLSIMRERAAAIGAAFSVESEPGLGTRVEVVL